MQLHVISDTHHAHYHVEPLPVCAEALVLAGDIVDNNNDQGLIKLAQNYLAQKLPVFFVPGNHEFYFNRLPKRLRALHKLCRKHGITMLHNNAVVVNGVRFLGATFWTDYALARSTTVPAAMAHAKRFMSDHTLISMPRDGRVITCLAPEDCLRMHQKSRRILTRLLAEPFEGPTVVVTHHAPSPKSVAAKYAGNAANPAFVSNVEAMMDTFKPAMWIHGHTHTFFDYNVGATRVVSNPHGYTRQKGMVLLREVPDFNHLFTVTV